MKRDQLNTQGDHLSLLMGTQPLNAGTQPLGKNAATRPLKETAQLRIGLEHTLAKAGRLASSLEQRVELLYRACEEGGLSVPGVSGMEYRHAITPQGRKIIAYLEKIVQLKPDLAKRIQVSIFRYQEAAEQLRTAREALKDDSYDEELLEQVKLKFFYLTTYHEDFKTDPLLTQMFPAPKDGTNDMGRSSTGHLMPDAIRKYRQQREAMVKRAEGVMAHLQPGMDQVKHMLQVQETAKGKSLLDIFQPAQRAEKLMAQRIKEDERACLMMRNALALFDQMRDQINEVKKGAKYEPLSEAIEYMGHLIGVWSQHSLLKEFFPTLERSLFEPRTGSAPLKS